MNNTATKILVILILLLSLGVITYEIISHSAPQSSQNVANTQTSDADQSEEDTSSQAQNEVIPPVDNTNDEIVCTLNFSPVCGNVNGVEKTFGNKCEAQKAGALNIVEGLCSPLESCPKEKDLVCGTVDGKKSNFDNLCVAEAAGATDIEPGMCPLIANPDNDVTLCPEMPEPVCATKDGKKTDYENACAAQQAEATEITPGKCPLALNPDLKIAP